MVENNLNSLAETLAKTGLASSTTQAMMMAKNIMGTEKRVSQHFDGKAHAIDDSLSKKSYKEEIQDLIEKTSPEKKNFHYMISGYKEAVQKEAEQEESFTELDPVEVRSEPSVSEILESPRQEVPEEKEEISVSVEEFKQPEESIEPISPAQIPNPVPEHIIQQPSMPVLEEKPAEPVMQNQAISQAIEKAQPVYSNNLELNEEMMLKDLMDEQAKEIYSDESVELSEPKQEVMSNNSDVQESAPEYTVFNYETEKPISNIETQEEPIQESIDPVEEEIAKDDDEFILPVQEEAPVEQEPFVKEIIQEKTKEFKNPIEKIDLMNHFKFG